MSRSTDQAGRAPVISIIGLEDLGLAIGHALQRVKTRYAIHGHDREPGRVRAALDAGAIDRGSWSLVDVTEAADLVFLTEPLDDACATLETIAPYARPGTLVTDTAGAKGRIMALAARVVPDGVSFIGGHPIPRRLGPAPGALNAPPGAVALSLEGATYCLSPLPSADDAAVRVLADLVVHIGAEPFFIDPAEHDALAAAVDELPRALAAALMRAVDRSPSARDLARMAGPAFDAWVAPLSAAGRSSASAPPSDVPAHLVRWLDQVTADLRAMRDALDRGDGEVAGRWWAEAEESRARWRSSETPAATADAFDEAGRQSVWRQLLFGRRDYRPPRGGWREDQG